MHLNNDLVNLLASFKGDDLVFIPNPGNAGDSFITAASYQLFDELQLRVHVGDIDVVYPGRVVIYGGGGNLIYEYSNAINFIIKNHSEAKALILLPHTIFSYGDLLANLGSNCYIFCREKSSYDYVYKTKTHAHIFLSHDLAINSDLIKMKSDWEKILKSKSYWGKNYLNNFKLFGATLKFFWRSKFLFDKFNAFRNDVEKTNIDIPKNNLDISAIFASRDMSIESSIDATCKLMMFLSFYSEVKTNRLHVCILALKLGKKVDFYANSYFKNKAIWEHSLKNQFTNLRWHD